MSGSAPRRTGGFTLVELLVVIAVVALLIGVLLPALSGARSAAQASKSSSNMRQIVVAFMSYAAEYRQQFPPVLDGIVDPETDKLNMHWYDETRIGQYLPQFDETNLLQDNPKNNTVGGGVFVSPAHFDGGRSYTMNFWAASAASYRQISDRKFQYFEPGKNPLDPFEGRRGEAFNAETGRASDLMLICEAWGIWPSEDQSASEVHWFTEAHVGREGLPGSRFGAGENPVNAAQSTQLWAQLAAPEMAGISGPEIPTYIPFYRHPRVADDRLTRTGSAHFAFMDGHVDMIAAPNVADDASGRSTYRALWSLRDERIEADFLGGLE